MKINILKKSRKSDNFVQTIHDMLDEVVKCLQPYYLGNASNAAEQQLTLWITDEMLTTALKTEIEEGRFKAEIIERLLVELGVTFREVTVINGPVPAGVKAEEVIELRLYFSIDRGVSAVVSDAASISIYNAQGSLMDERYTLDSNEIQHLPARKYNIGSGRQHALDHGGLRINHIAIDNRPEAFCLDLNRRVSRSHAHITHDTERGFMLWVDPRGTRMAGSRTQIFRDEAMIDVDNPHIPVVLQSGDIIVLAKSVYLLFQHHNASA